MPPKFGTSGLRGLVSELTDPLCAAYTRAFLEGIDHGGRLLVGHDLRPSSRRHLCAVAAGARALGVEVLDCGAVPTPALALAAADARAPAVMVTGSHIPADRNGLKFYTAAGEITKDDEARIAAGLRDWDAALDLADPTPFAGVNAAYVARFTGAFAPDTLAGLRIGLYAHSAVGRDALCEILIALGAEVTMLGRSEVFVPVDTEAISAETRDSLAAWGAGGAFDAMVSLDGDSDRPLVADGEGKVVAGDILGALTARFLGAEIVVTPVSSNTMVDGMGLAEVRRTRIGSPFVIAEMEAVLGRDPGARVVGYEANGGFLTGFTAPCATGPLPPLMTRDAVLPILCALAQGPLGDSLAALPRRRTATDRIAGVPTETSRALVAELTDSAVARAALFHDLGPETGIDLTEGLRVRFASGEIVHLRPSGNAPELRCYGEADDAARARAIVSTLLARIADRIGT